jgi:multidrug efflux pump subunit AcrB
MLDDFHHRHDSSLSADAIAARLQKELSDEIGEGLVAVFGAPPVEGLGTVGGFKLVIEDRGDNGSDVLQSTADTIVSKGNDSSKLQGLFTSYRADTPWLELQIDRTKAMMAGVNMQAIINTLQYQFGSYYVNDLNLFGRTWEVVMQNDCPFRMNIQDLKLVKIRNDSGGMVPLGTILDTKVVSGPAMILRYNMYPTAFINGNPGPGTSSGQAIQEMQDIARKTLPHSMKYEWTELAYLQLMTGSTAVMAFLLAVVLVFLVLAAQYESWSLPLAVILVVPMCLLCSIAGVLMAQMDINIFTQIGFIVLVGLASKNAILIVEFAKLRRDAGVQRREATLEACQLRLRPILMTSFAFILGVVPLMTSVGAGAEMRRTLGVAVFAGMLGVTMFGIFLTPVFYYVIQWYNDRRLERRARRRQERGESDEEIHTDRARIPAWASASPVPLSSNGETNGTNGDTHGGHGDRHLMAGQHTH